MANAFRVGSIDVIVVSDGAVLFPGAAYFQNTAADWEPHQRYLDHEGNLEFPLGCFVIRSDGRTVLVDTGIGAINRAPWRGGELLDDVQRGGVSPDEIDTVFVTHLHADHCGTVAMKDGDALRPAFPNATYRWTADEQKYWDGPLPPGSVKRTDQLEAVAPRWQAADGGTSLAPGVDVIAMPGHTPGHAGVVVSSGEERAFILGDAISCPVQLEESEWSGMGDVDPKLARRTQEALAKEAEGRGALLGASHFPGLTFGRVLRGEGRRYWQAV